jgi:hypothetical protein
MNSTPAVSRARRIAKSFAVVNAVSLSFSSARRIVATLKAEAAASSSVAYFLSIIRDAAPKKILWIGDRITDVHKNRGTVFTLRAAPVLKYCGART